MYIQLQDTANGRSLVRFHNINAAGHYIVSDGVPCVQKLTVPTALAHRMLALNGNARPAAPFGSLVEQLVDFFQLSLLLAQDFGYLFYTDNDSFGIYGNGMSAQVYQRPSKEQRARYVECVTELRNTQFPQLRSIVSTNVKIVLEEEENWSVRFPWKIKREQAHLLWSELTELRMWGELK